MQEELAVAQKIQQSLLPRGGLQAPGWTSSVLSVPCDETSGDYFDYIRRPGGRLAFVVGDVSGHGIGAALLMSTRPGLLRAFTAPGLVARRGRHAVERFLSDDVGPGAS